MHEAVALLHGGAAFILFLLYKDTVFFAWFLCAVDLACKVFGSMQELFIHKEPLLVLLIVAFVMLTTGYVIAAFLTGRSRSLQLQKMQAAYEEREQELQHQLDNAAEYQRELQDAQHETEKRLGMTRVGLQASNQRAEELRNRLLDEQQQLMQLRELLANADKKCEALQATEKNAQSTGHFGVSNNNSSKRSLPYRQTCATDQRACGAENYVRAQAGAF